MNYASLRGGLPATTIAAQRPTDLNGLRLSFPTKLGLNLDGERTAMPVARASFLVLQARAEKSKLFKRMEGLIVRKDNVPEHNVSSLRHCNKAGGKG
jgi:hypothetical protein